MEGGVQSSTQMNDICYCMHALSVSGLRREVLCSLLLLCLLPCYRIDDAVFGKQTGREAKKVVTHHGSVTHRRRGPRQHVSNAATPPLECAAVCAHTLVFVFQWYHSWNAAVLCLNACLCVLSTNDECWAKTLISYCFLFLQFAKEVVILRLTRMSEGLGGVTHSCCQHSSARMCVCHCQSRLILHITAKTVALGPFHCTANPASGPPAFFWKLKSHNCQADSDSSHTRHPHLFGKNENIYCQRGVNDDLGEGLGWWKWIMRTSWGQRTGAKHTICYIILLN